MICSRKWGPSLLTLHGGNDRRGEDSLDNGGLLSESVFGGEWVCLGRGLETVTPGCAVVSCTSESDGMTNSLLLFISTSIKKYKMCVQVFLKTMVVEVHFIWEDKVWFLGEETWVAVFLLARYISTVVQKYWLHLLMTEPRSIIEDSASQIEENVSL